MSDGDKVAFRIYDTTTNIIRRWGSCDPDMIDQQALKDGEDIELSTPKMNDIMFARSQQGGDPPTRIVNTDGTVDLDFPPIVVEPPPPPPQVFENWPVGSAFFSFVNTNPVSLIGVGTWVLQDAKLAPTGMFLFRRMS